MKKTKIKCKICGAIIDRSDCNNQYMIITEVDNNSIPVTNTRYYICGDHALLVDADILTRKVKHDIAESQMLRNKI